MSYINHYYCRNFMIRIILASLVILLSGCGLGGQAAAPLVAPAAPKPVIITVDMNAGNGLNPDIEGRPSPLVVRVYQLESIAAFNRGDFFALYENDQAVLGNDLKSKEEMEIKPEQKLDKKIAWQPGSHYLAIFAAFRDLDNAQWKAVVEVKPDQKTVFKIKLDRFNVTIEP